MFSGAEVEEDDDDDDEKDELYSENDDEYKDYGKDVLDQLQEKHSSEAEEKSL